MRKEYDFLLDQAERQINGSADMDTLADVAGKLKDSFSDMDEKQQDEAGVLLEDAFFWEEATSAKISWDGFFCLTGEEELFNSVYRTDRETADLVLSVAGILEEAGCLELADDLFGCQDKDALELIAEGGISAGDNWQYPASLKVGERYLAFSYGPDHDSLVEVQKEMDRVSGQGDIR